MLEPVWIWGILGLVLLAAEMATGTLYILWFGIAALCISGVLSLFPLMALPLQLLLFAVLALGSLAIWKFGDKRKTAPELRIGQSQSDEIGRVGSITAAVSPQHNGSIRFAQGLMGSREWAAISDEEIAVGEDAVVTGFEGNSLRVRR
jgi:membrane protein implicated in regulation of membrane protease activity